MTHRGSIGIAPCDSEAPTMNQPQALCTCKLLGSKLVDKLVKFFSKVKVPAGIVELLYIFLFWRYCRDYISILSFPHQTVTVDKLYTTDVFFLITSGPSLSKTILLRANRSHVSVCFEETFLYRFFLFPFSPMHDVCSKRHTSPISRCMWCYFRGTLLC